MENMYQELNQALFFNSKFDIIILGDNSERRNSISK